MRVCGARVGWGVRLCVCVVCDWLFGFVVCDCCGCVLSVYESV